jgi:cytochrome c6
LKTKGELPYRSRLLVAVVALAAPLLLTPLTSARPTVKLIKVTATDGGFRLSSWTAPKGQVTFVVTNTGKKPHDFRIAGKKTPVLAPGQSAKLVHTFNLAGNFPYLSTLGGDARAGLKGVFAALPPKAVGVTATDRAFRLSTKLGQVGQVAFVVQNTGKAKHDFRIAGQKTPVLVPGTGAALIVTFKRAAPYPYTSTVAGDAARGLKGTFTVRGGGTTTTTEPTDALAAGKKVFMENSCASCHVLKAGGGAGTIGPNLDRSKAPREKIVIRVTYGMGAMPPYGDQLTAQQIQDVADFVFQSRGS